MKKVLLRYDLDNNGYLNQHDFDCLAVKFTLLEGRGQWNKARYKKTKQSDLWPKYSKRKIQYFWEACKICDPVKVIAGKSNFLLKN